MANSPSVKEQIKELEIHNHKRFDPYYWMNERDHPDVLHYLHAENEYYESSLNNISELRAKVFEEMKSRIKEDENSAPWNFQGITWQVVYKKGCEYPFYTMKKKDTSDQPVEIFDVNELAKGYSYFNFTALSISPDNKFAAFATDNVGRRNYTIQFKNLETGEFLSEKIEGTTSISCWAADSKTIFYVKKDPQTLRSHQVWKHVLGNSTADDVCVYEEKDEMFYLSVYKSRSNDYVFIYAHSTLTTEVMAISASKPDEKPVSVWERKQGRIYIANHIRGSFYFKTNDNGADNFKLLRCKISSLPCFPSEVIIDHKPDSLLEGFDLFNEFIVVDIRNKALSHMHVYELDENQNVTYKNAIPVSDPVYMLSSGNNPEANTTIIRMDYSSLTTPTSVIDYNMITGESNVVKEQEIPGGNFNKNNYTSERIWVTAKDGTQIPVSLVRHINTHPSESTPLLQYAYGSYGHSTEAAFSHVRLSLLDRGFIYVIAHIRGGQEMGRAWYENGKFFKKWNTFTDFIDVSEYLIKNKYSSAKHLYAMGGSAGGLLMGAVINKAPHLYNGVIAAVPFVDVVTTMLDDSIPLTTLEYEEWGNPNQKDFYDYMLSYSPYDNVTNQNYPNMLVVSGYHDSQVQYWEPTKWVAKLRKMKTDKNLLLLRTNMDAGHGGASGRFSSVKERAEDYSFLLFLEGINE